MCQFKQINKLSSSISTLFAPFVEVVIHDLHSNKIVAIYNNFSKRAVGDDSLLQANELSKDFLGKPYEKVNYDGRPIKSISTLLEDEEGQAYGLLCINFDISFFKGLQLNIETLLGNVQEKPQSLFKNDWQERINQYVKQYVIEHKLFYENLSKLQKKQIIEELYLDGAFKTKGAALHIGNVLKLSRASVYKYLNECKSHEPTF